MSLPNVRPVNEWGIDTYCSSIASSPAAVSVYESFAWFYAVNTGQISIRHRMPVRRAGRNHRKHPAKATHRTLHPPSNICFSEERLK